MIKSSVFTILFLSVFFNTVKAQVFWTEDFSTTCASKCIPENYTTGANTGGAKGVWTAVAGGTTEGTNANIWFISYAEEGRIEGKCADLPKVNNGSLHISTAADQGAIYTKGGAAGGETDKRVISPVINCTGKSSIKLDFDFICQGDAAHVDHCDVEYSSDGTNFTAIQTNLVSNMCSSSVAMWQLVTISLPASADNNANVKIAFHWKNSSASGGDPSFAVDNIHLSSSSSSLITNPISGGPFCACSVIKVPYTASGVFAASNIFTAQLSNATGSFAAPIQLGTLSGTSLNDSIKATIPCNILPGAGYRIRVISSNPALTGSDVPITISAPLQIIVTPNPDTICIGKTATLYANGATPGKYQWLTLPVITSTDSIKVTPAKDTVYLVTGSKGSCRDTTIAKVYVDKLPIVKVTNDTTCIGLGASIKASGGTKYLWDTGSTLDSIIVFPTKDTSYTVTVTKGHCSVKATGNIKVYPTITISVTKDTSICAGQALTLKATGAISYTWSTIPPKTGSTIVVTPITTTTYTVTGIAGACKDDATVKVTVNPPPDVKVTASPDTICQGQSVLFKATGSDLAYYWLFPTLPPNSTKDTVTTKPVLIGYYKVVGLSAGGCIDTAQVFVKVNARPAVEVVSIPDSICVGGTAILIAKNADHYLWESGGVTSDTLKVSPLTDAIYKVYGFNGPGQACSDTAYGFVFVGVPVPVVVTGKTEIFSCESTQLFALPADGTYSWQNIGNGDGKIDCSTCPTTLVTPPTSQGFYVIYTSPYGCIGKDSIQINVININSYFIPTGFSPNGDGINDVVQVHGKGIDHVSLKIFDRIGEKVFETNELETGWDGTYLGILMNDNVFVYKLEVYYCNGETIKETGNITLLK